MIRKCVGSQAALGGMIKLLFSKEVASLRAEGRGESVKEESGEVCRGVRGRQV